MPTAQELGFVEESTSQFPQKLVAGTYEMIDASIEQDDKFGQYAHFVTADGKEYKTFSSSIIGNVASEKPKALGNLIRRAGADGSALTVNVSNEETGNGNTKIVASIF